MVVRPLLVSRSQRARTEEIALILGQRLAAFITYVKRSTSCLLSVSPASTWMCVARLTNEAWTLTGQQIENEIARIGTRRKPSQRQPSDTYSNL
jgi:hypothetical protein